MSIYDPVLVLLDKTLEEYKETISVASVIANRSEILDSFSLNQIIKANARAEAALRVRMMIATSKEEHLPDIIKLVQGDAKRALQGSNTHFSVVSFYNEVATALTAATETQKYVNT